MTDLPSPSKLDGARFGRLRRHRRRGLYAAGVVAMLFGGLCAFSPAIWSKQTYLPAAANLFAAVFVAFGTLAIAAGMFGRFGLSSTARKERRASSAAASVLLWLWIFAAVSGVLFAWRLLDLVGPALPNLLPHGHRVEIVRERPDGRTVVTVTPQRDGEEN